MAARMSAYSVIVWPRVLRTTDSRARMNIFVTDFIFRISFYPRFGAIKAILFTLSCLHPIILIYNHLNWASRLCSHEFPLSMLFLSSRSMVALRSEGLPGFYGAACRPPVLLGARSSETEAVF